jgi:hypothetical protein
MEKLIRNLLQKLIESNLINKLKEWIIKSKFLGIKWIINSLQWNMNLTEFLRIRQILKMFKWL